MTPQAPAQDTPHSTQSCFAHMMAQAAALGFEYCTFGLRMPLPITRPKTVYYSNYPEAWQRRYNEAGYIDLDPTIAHGMRSSAPVIWNDELFSTAPQLWKEAQSHGVRYGWAQSRRDPEGTFSMLVLARSNGPITAEELAEKEQHMQWLVHWGHAEMKSVCESDAVRPPPVNLSAREIEVLRWTAEGKTSAEIAELMNVSERTVNFHVNSVVAKLDACNKTSAAVRAAMLGLLW